MLGELRKGVISAWCHTFDTISYITTIIRIPAKQPCDVMKFSSLK